MNKNKYKTKLSNFLVIIRANFLLATIMPLLFGLVWVIQKNPSLIKTSSEIINILAIIIGTLSSHIAANMFNDYFDWQSGTDKINTNYIKTISGGSRAIENNLITELATLRWAKISFGIAALCATYLTVIKGYLVLEFSLIGAFAIYFYVAPPIRLAARKGLGELFVFLCFGPVFIAGIIYVLTGIIAWQDFLVGVPLGCLITSCLLINEYPDITADKIIGKNNLAVTFGNKTQVIVNLLIILAYLSIIINILLGIFPVMFLWLGLTLPLAVYEIILIGKSSQSRIYLERACVTNLKLYTCVGLGTIILNILIA